MIVDRKGKASQLGIIAQRTNNPYQHGRLCAQKGLSIASNPHPKRSVDRKLWANGWYAEILGER